MFDFITKLIYSVLALQEKILVKSSKKTLTCNSKSVYSNSTSKKAFGAAASLEFNTQTEKNKQKLENNVKIILKKYNNNPQKLLEFVERSGTNVYKIPFANKLLAIIGHEPGLITPIKGAKALYLNIIISVLTNKKITLSCETEPMFVLCNSALNNYSVMQQFHKWYAMKLKLPGLDSEAQDNLQKFLSHSNDSKIGDLTIDEILGLKEAIARDVESINFIIDVAKSTAGSKNALKKMIAGGASV